MEARLECINLTCPHCNHVNSFGATSHVEGKKLTCSACHRYFQQLTCPSCRRSNYFSNANYIEGIEYKCSLCGHKLQQITCPNCNGKA